MHLIIIRSTAVLSYHLRLLSSLIRVTVGGPTFSFVKGHIGGSLWTGLPPGGDPFVHHSVIHTEDEHELGLFPSLFFLHPFSLSSRSFLHLSLTIFSSLTNYRLGCQYWYVSRVHGCSDIWMKLWHSLLRHHWLYPPVHPGVFECFELAHDLEKHGGLELIVQTQFLRLPLWNQELWMDITPLASKNRRGTYYNAPRCKLSRYLSGWARNNRHAEGF